MEFIRLLFNIHPQSVLFAINIKGVTALSCVKGNLPVCSLKVNGEKDSVASQRAKHAASRIVGRREDLLVGFDVCANGDIERHF